ncbi:trypsin 3A1-like [Eurosta solidaginis]|uniref:trypsin 3A1-like n=1 Tax=Eurosta solidaginis TaxID=178769 RepID=UPI003530D7D3
MSQRNNFALLFVLLSSILSYTNAQDRMIYGTGIDITKYPHSVAIFIKQVYNCVGSIVGPKSVVTVAHCVAYELPQDVSVIAGATNIYTEVGQRPRVAEIIPHHDYTAQTQFLDIAVVKLTESFKDDGIAKIIPLCDDQLKPGEWMAVTGWGAAHKDDKTCSPILIGSGKELQFGDTGAGGVIDGRLCAVAQRIMDDSEDIYLNVANPRVGDFIRKWM